MEGDEVIEVKLTTGNDDIIIANHGGRAIRFNEQGVRVMGRTATGVRGIRLDGDDDEAVGMLVFNCNEELTDEQWAALDAQESNEQEVPETDAVEPVEEVEGAEEITANEWPENILVVSEKGFGKRSVLSDYRITKRGGKGVKTLNVTEKTGNLIAIKSVTDDDDLMIINKSGVAIRLAVREVKVQGRNTQGVSLINLKRRNDVIASVCKVVHEEPEEDALEENSEEAGNVESSEATNE